MALYRQIAGLGAVDQSEIYQYNDDGSGGIVWVQPFPDPSTTYLPGDDSDTLTVNLTPVQTTPPVVIPSNPIQIPQTNETVPTESTTALMPAITDAGSVHEAIQAAKAGTTDIVPLVAVGLLLWAAITDKPILGISPVMTVGASLGVLYLKYANK
jgi:hypothetical protein